MLNRRSRNSGGQLYERINDADVDLDDDDSEVESGEIAAGDGEGFANGNAGVDGRGRGGSGLQRALSSPTYVPANIPESGKSSGTEESEPDTPRRPRRVRFQNLAQGRYFDTICA